MIRKISKYETANNGIIIIFLGIDNYTDKATISIFQRVTAVCIDSKQMLFEPIKILVIL